MGCFFLFAGYWQLLIHASRTYVRNVDMVRLSLVLFAILALCLSPATSADVKHCFTDNIRRIQIDAKARAKVLFNGVLEGHAPVVVGFDPVGHAYLSVGGRRFDTFPLSRGKVEAKGITNEGYLFQLDIKPEQLKQLEQNLDTGAIRGKRDFSCIHGVCRALKEIGVGVKDRSFMSNVSAKKLFQDIASNGFMDLKSGQPIKVSIFQLSDHTFGDVNDGFAFQQKKVVLIKFGAGIVLISAGFTIKEKTDRSAKREEIMGQNISDRSRKEETEAMVFEYFAGWKELLTDEPASGVLFQRELDSARLSHPDWTYGDFIQNLPEFRARRQ